MRLYVSWKEWRRKRARKLLEDEIKENTSELRANLYVAKTQAESYKLQIEQEKTKADEANQELEEAGQAYKREIEAISLREQQVRDEKEKFITDSRENIACSRKSLEELTKAHQAATAEMLSRIFPEKVQELGLDKGLFESYNQQKLMIASLLEYGTDLSNQILIAEAESLEAKKPRLAKWPIAVIRGGEIMYSTRKFKKRLRAIPKQKIVEQIEREKEVYSLLCRGKEALIQIDSSKGESYYLALIPHMQKGRSLPDAIFAYLSPPEKHERLSKPLGKIVRDMGHQMYHKLDNVRTKLPNTRPDNYGLNT
ncbi:MAG: hypothetical protein ABH840_00890 [Nanoarchaeota archaeon]